MLKEILDIENIIRYLIKIHINYILLLHPMNFIITELIMLIGLMLEEIIIIFRKMLQVLLYII